MNVEEIRAVRVAEYERTKNMTKSELLADSQKKGGELYRRLLESQKQKKAVK